MHSIWRWILAFCLSVLINKCSTARILAVFPLASASHSAVLHTITVELAKRGHELVVFDAYSAGKEIEQLRNYREYQLKENVMSSEQLRQLLKGQANVLRLLMDLPEISETLMNRTFSNEDMARLISPSHKGTFDLIMIEWISWDSLNALGYRFNAPVIGLITVPITMLDFTMGLSFPSIDIPLYMTGETGEKTFIDRLKGFVTDLAITSFRHYTLYRQQRIVEKFFGQDYPHVYDMMRNVSMIFTDQDHVMPHPAISAPNIINIGGIHVSRGTDQQLPSDVKDFLDTAEKGFVYFSLGSTLPGHYMPDEIRRIFTEVFAAIPYRVIWKWEDDHLPEKPDNVLISKWLPQRAILAHPAIKAFIYQGGLQSTEEAIAAAVPLVALPIFGDQQQNVNKMVHIGGAIKLNIHSLTTSDLKQAITEVAENKNYKKQIIKFRDLLNDRPYDPVNHTMWWIEYVIRHKGAHHLRLVRSSLLWYQAQNLDVIAFCAVILFILMFIIYKSVKLTVCYCCYRQNQSVQKVKQS
ncbi:UDP-glucuronosyltransferase [Diachasma alloeum]|uniref:UDP-glucuronosyltransferase n=1 Tax=Diachasma alloeum TaxID=454923 RepID=UPI0007385102|nr:UDP-glucuronosyltransferase [Diachasma alloeum]